jgi:lipoic acid synthetase
MKETLRKFNARTVCEKALCPNIADCFNYGVATFLILGDVCTRDCAFCAVTKGTPKEPDLREPQNILKAVRILNLSYVVITSPTRDDLKDAGASLFYQAVKAIKNFAPAIKVEILIPDFLGKRSLIKQVVAAGPDVVSHNLETTPSLYGKVRKGADYQRSLKVLKAIKQANSTIYTKSGIMLGLGEQEMEILQVFEDLRRIDCDFLTLGQYLAPSQKHYPVKAFISPKKFQYFAKEAYSLGFKAVKSSPYCRSSYLAHTFLT